MPTHARFTLLSAFAMLALVAALGGAPYTDAEPDAEQAAAGSYRVVFDNSLESDRTWQINRAARRAPAPA